MRQESVGKRMWHSLWPLLVIWAAILAFVALSFLLVGGLTWRTYSDRLFWGGIAAILVGGFGALSGLGSYTTLGTPSMFTAPGDAPIAHERIWDQIKMNAGRYMFTFRMFVVGALCIGASAMIEVLSR